MKTRTEIDEIISLLRAFSLDSGLEVVDANDGSFWGYRCYWCRTMQDKKTLRVAGGISRFPHKDDCPIKRAGKIIENYTIGENP